MGFSRKEKVWLPIPCVHCKVFFQRTGPLHWCCSPQCYIKENSVPNGNGCWIWKGKQLEKRERGVACFGAEKIKASRFSYQTFKGPLSDDLFVCHTCDNPSCVNPEHLKLGTRRDNVDDMMFKERQHKPTGEINPTAKITDEIALAIFRDPRSTREIMNTYGVSKHRVSVIKRGKGWTHVTGYDTKVKKKIKSSPLDDKL